MLSRRYDERCCYWESVLLSHRLWLALLATFAHDVPLLRQFGAVFVSFGYFAAHLIVQPFRRVAHARVQLNDIQGSLLAALCVVATLNLDAASVESHAVSGAAVKEAWLVSLVDVSTVVQLLLLFLPLALLVFAHALAAARGARRTGCSAVCIALWWCRPRAGGALEDAGTPVTELTRPLLGVGTTA